MSEHEDGGPAFPYARSWQNERKGYMEYEHKDGMTLRDYFAARVLPTLIDNTATYGEAARAAYKIADAMLRERER